MALEICYLNTDRDLVAPRDLSPLAAALEARGVNRSSPSDDNAVI